MQSLQKIVNMLIVHNSEMPARAPFKRTTSFENFAREHSKEFAGIWIFQTEFCFLCL